MSLSKRASGIIVGVILLGLGVGIGAMLTHQSATAELVADPAHAGGVVGANSAVEAPSVNVSEKFRSTKAESKASTDANTLEAMEAEAETVIIEASIDEGTITIDQAKAAAEAAVPEASVLKVERAVENGVEIYSIELNNDQAVKVDAKDGGILYIELVDNGAAEVAQNEAAAQGGINITAEEAKEIAEKAFDGARAVELELERENGGLVYEVELDNGSEIEIDAATGHILEIDLDDDDDESLELQEASGITPDQARKIAEEAAGSGAKAVELELERENGGLVYEVELDNGIEVEINADTGDVLEIEQDDD